MTQQNPPPLMSLDTRFPQQQQQQWNFPQNGQQVLPHAPAHSGKSSDFVRVFFWPRGLAKIHIENLLLLYCNAQERST